MRDRFGGFPAQPNMKSPMNPIQNDLASSVVSRTKKPSSPCEEILLIGNQNELRNGDTTVAPKTDESKQGDGTNTRSQIAL